jgi:MYXO-CTERM domain-containing protein
VVRICSTFCEADADCPFGFDCRLVDPQQPPACVRGHADCGAPFNAETCLAGVRVDTAEGESLCSCRCIAGSAGACPTGMKCADVSCLQARDGLLCVEATPERAPNEAPRCVPDPAWRAACETDAQCSGGQHCLDGTCQPDRLAGACAACALCDGPDDCGPDHQCVAFPDSTWRCTRPCEADTDCAGDAVCRDVAGQDGKRCASPGDDRLAPCAADWRCSAEGRCQTDTDCPEGDAEGACVEGFCPGFEPEPTPDAGINADASTRPDVGVGSDGTVVIAPPRAKNDGCAAAPGSTGSAPWSALLLLLGLGAVRRPNRRAGRP